MSDFLVMDWDDLGCDRVISDKCQSHDCRDQLDKLHYLNPKFKCTLFAIPGEMTQELLNWCKANRSWVELAVHGFYHTSNYECEKIIYEAFSEAMADFGEMIDHYFVKVFRAPGWQISNDAIEWLYDHDWIIADQGYNDDRRPKEMKAYVNYEGNFTVYDNKNPYGVKAYHGHTWDVGWNGIYEDYDKVEKLVREAEDFKFISELF